MSFHWWYAPPTSQKDFSWNLRKLRGFNELWMPYRYKGRYKMSIRMTKLTRKPNGNWFEREVFDMYGIPAGVCKAYKLAYGKSQEEQFRREASLPLNRAKLEFAAWLAEIEDRINRLRSSVDNGNPCSRWLSAGVDADHPAVFPECRVSQAALVVSGFRLTGGGCFGKWSGPDPRRLIAPWGWRHQSNGG